MSNQSVIIKSNRYGLVVLLDDQPDWDTIKNEVAEKFRSSDKFFGDAQMALSFQGRKLSAEEEAELLKIIGESCRIQIVCVVEENTAEEQAMKAAVESRRPVEQHDLANLQDGRFCTAPGDGKPWTGALNGPVL